jgi:hypothetical protein
MTNDPTTQTLVQPLSGLPEASVDEPGEGMVIYGMLWMWLGIVIAIGSAFMSTSVHTGISDAGYGLSLPQQVVNLELLQRQMMIALGGGVMAILGALFHCVGRAIRQIARTAKASL